MSYVYFLAAAYIGINVYVWFRLRQLLNVIFQKKRRGFVVAMIIYTIIHLFLMTSVISWTLFSDETIIRSLKYINNVWIGIFVYLILLMVVGEIVTFVHWLIKRKTKPSKAAHTRFVIIRTAVIVIFVALFSVYGVCHADDIKLKNYAVTIDKESTEETLRVALVSDFHLGYSVGDKQIEKMVQVINSQSPDVVVIAGDIIDNEFYAIADADAVAESLSKIRSKYGVYAVYGNHDVQEKLVGGFSLYTQDENLIQPEVDTLMEKAGITVLQDEVVTIGDDIQLIGRIDGEKPNEYVLKEEERKTIGELTEGLDKNHLIIDIDHEPDELEEKAEAGVDVDLCGHTHNGQLAPGNLLLHLFWENPYGMEKINNMYSIVTSGIGVWGPAMRVGTDAEVVMVNINTSR